MSQSLAERNRRGELLPHEIAAYIATKDSGRWFERDGKALFQPCGGCPNGGVCATMDSCAAENPEDYR